MDQSPTYPMQLMLNIYEFGKPPGARAPGVYPKRFVVEHFRGWRPTRGPAARAAAFAPDGPIWRGR